MNIVTNSNNQFNFIKDLKPGEVFKCGTGVSYFMKIEENDSKYNAVELNNGDLAFIDPYTKVIAFPQAKVVI